MNYNLIQLNIRLNTKNNKIFALKSLINIINIFYLVLFFSFRLELSNE